MPCRKFFEKLAKSLKQEKRQNKILKNIGDSEMKLVELWQKKVQLEENGSNEKKNRRKKEKRSESKVEELSCGGKEPGSRSLSLSHPSRQSPFVF